MKSGDVVCATYGDFNCEKRVGIFVVLYSENNDRKYSYGHSNILACKITTNNFQGDSYTVRIYQGDGGLEDDCLVNVSKVHTFATTQVYKKLGHLKKSTMSNIYKELRRFNYEVESQVMGEI